MFILSRVVFRWDDRESEYRDTPKSDLCFSGGGSAGHGVAEERDQGVGGPRGSVPGRRDAAHLPRRPRRRRPLLRLRPEGVQPLTDRRVQIVTGGDVTRLKDVGDIFDKEFRSGTRRCTRPEYTKTIYSVIKCEP